MSTANEESKNVYGFFAGVYPEYNEGAQNDTFH
jgi:hypothetical protein